MEYSEFLMIIKIAMEEKLGKDYGVIITKVLNYNGVEQEALCMVKGLKSLAPAMYLYGYYEQLLNGASLADMVEIVMVDCFEIIEKFDNLSDFESIKDKVVFQLIRTDDNQELLKTVPNLSYFDLSIVFHVLSEEKQLGYCSIMIFNENIKLWRTTVYELYQLAMSNTPRLLPANIISIGTLIAKKLNGRTVAEDLSGFKSPFYILSNKFKRNGACAVLYENLLLDFSNKMEQDIFIIFTSTDEVLLIPISGQKYLYHLGNHDNRVDCGGISEELMSNVIYYYNWKSHKIQQY